MRRVITVLILAAGIVLTAFTSASAQPGAYGRSWDRAACKERMQHKAWSPEDCRAGSMCVKVTCGDQADGPRCGVQQVKRVVIRKQCGPDPRVVFSENGRIIDRLGSCFCMPGHCIADLRMRNQSALDACMGRCGGAQRCGKMCGEQRTQCRVEMRGDDGPGCDGEDDCEEMEEDDECGSIIMEGPDDGECGDGPKRPSCREAGQGGPECCGLRYSRQWEPRSAQCGRPAPGACGPRRVVMCVVKQDCGGSEPRELIELKGDLDKLQQRCMNGGGH